MFKSEVKGFDLYNFK